MIDFIHLHLVEPTSSIDLNLNRTLRETSSPIIEEKALPIIAKPLYKEVYNPFSNIDSHEFIGFQCPATLNFERILDLHHNISFFLIILSFFIF